MKFKQLENGYFQSEDKCMTIPNVVGNRHFDKIKSYIDEGNKLSAQKEITVPDDYETVIPEPEPDPVEIEPEPEE